MENTAVTLAPGIFTLPRLFTADECAGLIVKGETLGFEGRDVSLPGVRNNDRAIWDDAAYAAQLWERVGPLLPGGPNGEAAIGLNERFRFYRYAPGQQFTRHSDQALDLPPRVVDGLSLPMGRSLTTFLLYLGDDCKGGETAFYTNSGWEIVRVRPETGMALCFTHEIRHEGCLVTAGRKYVLRSDIMYPRHW